jgi:NAD(P)-dependent dehydrogenase (short-subunit alcohol dehydrogenase family)
LTALLEGSPESLEPPNAFRLDGQVAMVTGASSGIGAQCARVLHDAGATVAVVARRRERLDQLVAELDRGLAVAADLVDVAVASEVVERVVSQLGRIDVLVNAAGITNPVPATRESVDDIGRLLAVNVAAPLALSQAALAAMRTHDRGGAIVNVASIAARNSEPTIPAASYAASKGALTSLTRELAVQWARYGVRVNALAPGWFPTEMTAGLTAVAERVEYFASRIPLGRLGRLPELDGPLLLLASPAGSYITGHTLFVDGGLTAV